MVTTEEIVLFALFIAEIGLILIINIITIIAFARTRQLRKRSTYLIINLTVADLLVGAVTVPLCACGYHLQFDKYSGFTWPRFFIITFVLTFPLASQVNLSLISLERLHATLFPFRHCLIRKWFYFKIILGSWVVSSLLASIMSWLQINESALSYMWLSFTLLVFLVLAVSYVIIILNVQSSPHSQHHGSINTEKKLSITLLIVTGVSVLTVLPLATYNSMPANIQERWSTALSGKIGGVAAALYFASSIVNPFVYAIRMQEFRKAIGKLLAPQSRADHRYGREEQSRV